MDICHSCSPVFYAALDPTRIPLVLARFDSSGWTSIKRDIIHVHRSLCGVLHLARLQAIHRGAFVDLWNTVWPWVVFLDEYEESIALDDILRAEIRYLRFMRLIRFLHDDEATNRIIASPSGLYVVVGRAWRHLVHAKSDGGISDVSHFLRFLFDNDWDAAAFDELIVGCGGTRLDLAALIVSHIQRLLPSAHSSVTSETICHLMGIRWIVNCAAVPHEPDPVFQKALLSCGIVNALTAASRALCESTDHGAGRVLKGFFPALVDHISSFPSLWLTESLRTGLLDIVFAPRHRDAISSSLSGLFNHVLLPAAAYHSVLVQFRISLGGVRDVDAAAIFDDAALLAHWESFLEVAENRCRILGEYENGTLMAPRVCDDLEVGYLMHALRGDLDFSPGQSAQKVFPKQDLKRCGGCLTTYYCSPKCQANDWECGGHRQACGDLSSRREQYYSRHSARDRSFLRTLVYHEYTTRREEIAQKHLLLVKQYPSELPSTAFDFTKPNAEIVVGPLEGLRPLLEFEVEKATRSGGKTELYVAKVLYGDHGMPRVWPFLLHVRTVDWSMSAE
ncbi:MYND-type domain-containing protein [Mycena sanguinolenta]|uniref:MYND-type domain-containing protein n=1 Tax=Mycena sanguinolenta TaxID=230812 RepID=A0A8H6TWT0_9AGAR|nr:MYND-type domain-containing protein [Mycena sanguinolenta]